MLFHVFPPFSSQTEKIRKRCKNSEKVHEKGGLPAFFLSVCDGKTWKIARNEDFDQQTACGVPVCWSKYTKIEAFYDLHYKSTNIMSMATT